MGLVGDVGFGFDLDAPGGVEEGGHDDHGGCGAGNGEELAVDAADLFPVFGAGEVDAGADDVLDGGAGFFEGGGDDGEDLVGLGGGVCVIGADGTGSGDVDDGADADGAGEADDGLVGAGSGDVGAGGHVVWMCRSGAGCGFDAVVCSGAEGGGAASDGCVEVSAWGQWRRRRETWVRPWRGVFRG